MNQPPRGILVKRVRNKLGLSQKAFAPLIGLESKESVGFIERGDTRNVRGDTLEAILELCGYLNEEELDAAAQAGVLPDISEVRRRIAERGIRLPRIGASDAEIAAAGRDGSEGAKEIAPEILAGLRAIATQQKIPLERVVADFRAGQAAEIAARKPPKGKR